MCCRRQFRAVRPNRAVHSMRFFYNSIFSLQYSPRLQVTSPLSTRSFCESILFLHLKALRGGELRLVRTAGMVRLNSWQDPVWNFEQKMSLALRPPSHVSCSPSSTQTHIIIRDVEAVISSTASVSTPIASASTASTSSNKKRENDRWP